MTDPYPMESLRPQPSGDGDFPADPRLRGRTPVFAVTSGRSGVGKTNIVANLTAALQRKAKRVMAIDAALPWPDLNAFFDVQPLYSLDEFFSGNARLDEIIVSPGDGIYLMPGAATGITQLSSAQKLALLTELDELPHELDLVLVETASGVSDTVTYFASAAHEILVVITPDPESVAGAYALIEALASTRREKRFRILANQVADSAEALLLFDRVSAPALRFLNASLDLIGWIPYDSELASCSARVQPIVLAAAHAPSATAIDVLADTLIASTPPRIKGSLQFFLRRMLEQGRARV